MTDIKPIKVAFTGTARSGKDVSGEYIRKQHGFQRFAFGDGIREICTELFPERMRSQTKDRALLQGVGQSLRAYDIDVWLNRTMRKIDAYIDARIYDIVNDGKPYVMITDVRQPNEYKRLKREGFVLIRVNASDETRIARMQAEGDVFNPEDLSHETESYIERFRVNYDVYNTGDLPFLHAQLDKIMAELIG